MQKPHITCVRMSWSDLKLLNVRPSYLLLSLTEDPSTSSWLGSGVKCRLCQWPGHLMQHIPTDVQGSLNAELLLWERGPAQADEGTCGEGVHRPTCLSLNKAFLEAFAHFFLKEGGCLSFGLLWWLKMFRHSKKPLASLIWIISWYSVAWVSVSPIHVSYPLSDGEGALELVSELCLPSTGIPRIDDKSCPPATKKSALKSPFGRFAWNI